MKHTLLICLTFLAINFSFGATHQINWTVGYHGTTNITIGDTVQWNFVGFHDVISSGSPSFASSATQTGGSYSITFNTLGDYYYFCSVHGAANMDGNIVVSPILGIEEVDVKPNFSIYPNPSTDVLNLKLPNNSIKATIEVYDVLGKRIHQSAAIRPSSIRISDWETGFYFVTVNFGDYKVTKRFIKK